MDIIWKDYVTGGFSIKTLKNVRSVKIGPHNSHLCFPFRKKYQNWIAQFTSLFSLQHPVLLERAVLWGDEHLLIYSFPLDTFSHLMPDKSLFSPDQLRKKSSDDCQEETLLAFPLSARPLWYLTLQKSDKESTVGTLLLRSALFQLVRENKGRGKINISFFIILS